MDCALWDIKGSEGYIYSVLRNRSDVAISRDRSQANNGHDLILQRQHLFSFRKQQMTQVIMLLSNHKQPTDRLMYYCM